MADHPRGKPNTIETRLFLNGEFKTSLSGKTFDVINPSTEQVAATVFEALPEDVDSAVAAAQAAFPAWSRLEASERATYLLKLADGIENNLDEIGYLEAITMGKPYLGPPYDWVGRHTVDVIRHSASLAMEIMGETSLNSKGFVNLSLRQPFGVGAAIVPWNGPTFMLANKIGPGLIAGNTMVVKSSEKSPLSALVIARIANEIGLPAGSILGYVLVSSQTESIFKAAQVNNARNISMAERAQIFDSADSINYHELSLDTFHWGRWKEEETCRRVACRIFCQDMSRCVFRRKSPSFSPFAFDVLIPCYDVCWEAGTKEECLAQLQSLPKQMLVSTVLKQLGAEYIESVPTLEASAFGMFILILSIHCLLFQLVQNNIERSSDIALGSSTAAAGDPDPLSRFRDDFSGKHITGLADELVATYGSETMRRINMLLDRWYWSWECRQNRDTTREDRTFSGDPLRFFWLAKLYVVLHFYRHNLSKDSEFSVLASDSPGDRAGQAHLKTIGWLSRFRERQADPAAPTWTDHYLRQFTQRPSS